MSSVGCCGLQVGFEATCMIGAATRRMMTLHAGSAQAETGWKQPRWPQRREESRLFA